MSSARSPTLPASGRHRNHGRVTRRRPEPTPCGPGAARGTGRGGEPRGRGPRAHPSLHHRSRVHHPCHLPRGAFPRGGSPVAHGRLLMRGSALRRGHLGSPCAGTSSAMLAQSPGGRRRSPQMHPGLTPRAAARFWSLPSIATVLNTAFLSRYLCPVSLVL